MRFAIDGNGSQMRAELHAELDELEARLARARLPDSFAAAAFELKQNIRFIQERYRS